MGSRGFGKLCRLGVELQRKFDPESGATRGHVFDENRSAVFGDDPVANAQAQSRALSDRFGSVKGIEDARRILYARTAIRKFDKEQTFLYAGFDPQVAFLTIFQDGVHSVVNEIQENLLQLVRIRRNFRKVGCQIQMDADLAHAQIIVTERQSIFNRGVEANGNSFGFMLSGKAEKVLHDSVSALSLLVDFLGIAERQGAQPVRWKSAIGCNPE